MTAQPFTINVSESVLNDLRSRLARTRWTDEIEGAGWDYGTDRDYLKSLVDYWQNEFDWRAQEAALNQLPHFRADVDGVGIHFIHVRGKGPNPQPLILTHGWPDSFVRMLKVIPLLTDPARFGGDPGNSFDVVVPSIPGYGFSDRAHQRGMNTARTADLWAKLMADVLGYQRFGAAGGDLGSVVTLHLAHRHPDLLTGIHLTDVSYPQELPEGVPFSEAAGQYFSELGAWWMNEAAYNMLQSTKPQTVAYSLIDSPVGLAAWIVEKFRSWGDCNGDIESRFSKDELLTNIMIYWVTETISSSARMYYEEAHNEVQLYPSARIEVPVGIAKFKDVLPPREWVEHDMNVQRWEVMPRGGHFAALEEPELFAGELRAFFGSLRK